jgi:hypothetical protein
MKIPTERLADEFGTRAVFVSARTLNLLHHFGRKRY